MAHWSGLTPKWVARNWKHLPRMQSNLRRSIAQAERLAKHIDRQRTQVQILGQVTEIWDGVPVGIDKRQSYSDKIDYDISVIAGDQWVHVYPNARNKGETYGVHLRRPDDHGGRFLGADFTEQEGLAIAREYLTTGRYDTKRKKKSDHDAA